MQVPWPAAACPSQMTLAARHLCHLVASYGDSFTFAYQPLCPRPCVLDLAYCTLRLSSSSSVETVKLTVRAFLTTLALCRCCVVPV